MTVVAEGGLVGYVVSVEDKSAKVQTIVDTASAVSAVFDNTEKSLVYCYNLTFCRLPSYFCLQRSAAI